jgi:hypothetical protein
MEGGLLRGGVLGGTRGGLAVPGGKQFRLNFGPLRRRQFGLVSVGRHVMNRKVGAGFLGAGGRVGRRADQRQIRNCGRAAAKGKRRYEQRSRGKSPPGSIHRHPSETPPHVPNQLFRQASFAAGRTLFSIGKSPQRSNHCRSKRLKPEQQIAPLGLQYDRTKILYRSAARQNTRLTSTGSLDQRGDELETNL